MEEERRPRRGSQVEPAAGRGGRAEGRARWEKERAAGDKVHTCWGERVGNREKRGSQD